MKPRAPAFKTGDTAGWSVVDWTGVPLIHRKTRDEARAWLAAHAHEYEGLRLVRNVVAK